MNATYLLMSVPFVAFAVAITGLAAWKFGLRLASLGAPIAVLLAGTAVFDNLIIWSGLVAYDESRILGVRIGLAPIEDFLYAIAAVMIVASLWKIFGRKESP
jgi:lycopene cyclase domain-containing protein